VNAEELKAWMSKVNTQTLELILLSSSPGKPEWYSQAMASEIQKRKAAKKLKVQ
jgi:hypothetical protein